MRHTITIMGLLFGLQCLALVLLLSTQRLPALAGAQATGLFAGILALGAVAGAVGIFVLRRETTTSEAPAPAKAENLVDVLEGHFSSWNLSPAEREVAWLTFKGFTNQEIADLRGTREGTIKAQTYAIFRKAGVNSRTQLLAYFMDDMLQNVAHPDRSVAETKIQPRTFA